MSIFLTFAKAFVVGGLICVIGQILMQTFGNPDGETVFRMMCNQLGII